MTMDQTSGESNRQAKESPMAKQGGGRLPALMAVDDTLDNLFHIDRLLNAAALASFALKGDDTDAVAEVIEVARGSVKVARSRLEQAIEIIQQEAGKAA